MDHDPGTDVGRDPAGSGREVCLVLDPLLADVWAFAWASAPDEPVAAPTGTLLRLAYLQGYRDAYEEEEPGGLFRRFGVQVPLRKRRSGRRSHPAPGSRDSSDT